MVVSNPRNDGTAERRNEKQRNGIFFLLVFFFLTKKQHNNKQTVNISHKIKGMHIFFILRGRSRAKLSSLFRVMISRRSVTDCPSDLLAPIETMKRTKSKQVKKAVDKKIDGLEKLLSPQLKLVEAFTAVKRKNQENYFKDKVFNFRVQSLILKKYSPSLLNFLELY